MLCRNGAMRDFKCADNSTVSSSRSCKTYECQTDDYTTDDYTANTCCDLKPRMWCSGWIFRNPSFRCPTLSEVDSSASCATYDRCVDSDFNSADSPCCKVDYVAVAAAKSAAIAAAAAREASAAQVAAVAAKDAAEANATRVTITVVVAVAGVAFLIVAVYV